MPSYIIGNNYQNRPYGIGLFLQIFYMKKYRVQHISSVTPPLEFVFPEQSYSSLHSGGSLAWHHRGRVDDLSFFEYLSPFCFLSIELHCTFSISYKILLHFVYYYCILIRM